MKPFNLKEALDGKSVVTRNGKEVTQLAYFPKASEYPVIAMSGTAQEVDTYTIEGEFVIGVMREKDLFMASATKTGWVNIYRDNIGKFGEYTKDVLQLGKNGHSIHPSKEEADIHQNSAKERIAVIELTWEE